MVNANWPAVVLQVEFVAGTWTSLPNRVQKVSTSRGRQYELDTVRAGTLNVTLDNFDGALDPTNTASTYYPNVKLMKRVRVMATWNSVTYPIFTGYVERWPQRWGAAGNGQWTDLIAFDAIGSLAQQDMEPVFYETVKLLSPQPLAWWPLDDGPTATMFNSRVSGIPPATLVNDLGTSNAKLGTATTARGVLGVGSAAFTTPKQTTVTGPSGFQLTTDSNTSHVQPPAQASIPTTGGWTVMFGIKADPANVASSGSGNVLTLDNPRRPYQATYPPGTNGYGIHLSFSGNRSTGYDTTVFELYDGDLQFGSQLLHPPLGTMPNLADGNDHFVAVSVSADRSTLKFGMDGKSYPAANLAIPTAMRGVPYPNVALADGLTGSVSNFMVFVGDQLASGGVYASLANTYLNANYGQATDTRFSTISTYVPFAGLATSVATPGASNMQWSNIAGKTAAAALTDTATADTGFVYVSAAGVLTFAGRNARYNPTPSYTFGETSSELPYEGLVEDYDLTHVSNVVTATQPGGIVVTAKDGTSAAAYGARKLPRTVDVTDQQQVVDAAGFLLAKYAQPTMRVPSLKVSPGANPALFPAALGIDLNTPVTVTRRPLAGVGFSRPFWVEAIRTSIDFQAGDFSVAYDLSPGDANTYLTWDDAVRGTYDGANLYAY